MNFSSVRYLTREGVRNIKKNWIMSLASIIISMLCLFLTGFIVLSCVSLNKVVNDAGNKNNVIIYLEKSIEDEESSLNIIEEVKNVPNVLECVFVSKEEILEKYSGPMGSLLEGLKGEENPFQNTLHIKMKNQSKYIETADIIKKIAGVESMSDKSATAETLSRFANWFSKIVICLIVFFAFISLLIVTNTIKATMYSRRLEIGIMKSVGATSLFIRIPFIIEGVILGMVAAIISTGLLKPTSKILVKIFKRLFPFAVISFENVKMPIIIAFLSAGVLFGLIGGFISISRYLKKEGGEIFGL